VTDADIHHLSGDILATTAVAIGGALSALPHRRLEISSEVTFEGDSFGVAIYPISLADEGREHFLIGGEIWLSAEKARELVATIGSALEQRGVLYKFELAISRNFDAPEITSHPAMP
jgi:hypothetical protein